MSRPFIDFYHQIGFAPTGQQGELSLAHSKNRDNLYRKLGLHDALFKGANILEIGPGSGENSLDILSRGVESLTLIDAVPVILESIKTRVDNDQRVKFEIADLSSSTPNELFDLVVCEGVIPNQLNPASFLRNVAAGVKPGGLIMITTMDEISLLSEILRRFLAHTVFEVRIQNTNQIVEFFQSDFSSLPGMTRNQRDWVLDVIHNPWVGNLFSVSEACLALQPNYRPIALTPNLFEDLSWYKNALSALEESKNWISKFNSVQHLLIDSRINVLTTSSDSLNETLRYYCLKVVDLVKQYIAQDIESPRQELLALLESLLSECPQIAPQTKNSLFAYCNWLNSGDLGQLKDFRTLWGRGQQHIVFQNSQTG